MLQRILLVLTAILCLSPTGIEGCSCAPEHPQQKYCRADYAMKITVAKRRNVIVQDDGSVVVLDKRGKIKRPTKTDKEIAGSGEGDVTGNGAQPAPIWDINELFWNRRANYISEARGGPDTRMPGFQPRYRESGEGRPRRLARKRNMPPGHLIKEPSKPKSKYEGRKMIQYTITILKVYKTNNSDVTDNKQHAYLYTPPICTVNFKTRNHTVYLVLGRIRDNKMEVELCDYRAEIQTLGERQRRNLLQNLRYGYKCDMCQITVCRGRRATCEARIARNQNPFHCFWKDGMTAFHPMASQFACKRSKTKAGKNTGKCQWVNGADRDLTPESIMDLYGY